MANEEREQMSELDTYRFALRLIANGNADADHQAFAKSIVEMFDVERPDSGSSSDPIVSASHGQI